MKLGASSYSGKGQTCWEPVPCSSNRVNTFWFSFTPFLHMWLCLLFPLLKTAECPEILSRVLRVTVYPPGKTCGLVSVCKLFGKKKTNPKTVLGIAALPRASLQIPGIPPLTPDPWYPTTHTMIHEKLFLPVNFGVLHWFAVSLS